MAESELAARGAREVAAIPVEAHAFGQLAEAWGLSGAEQLTLLGSPPRSSYFKWRKEGGALPGDVRERVSHLLGIWKALNIQFSDPAVADGWLRRSNHAFEDASALDVMLGGRVADIIKVRDHLDAFRGG